MSYAQLSPERIELERRAAAQLELDYRARLKRSHDKTVYGVVSPKKGLIRCWQEQEGDYTEVETEPTILIPEKLEPIVITPKPIKLIEGGRGGGKSETVSGVISCKVKDYGLKVGAFREFQNSIEDSVHSIISKKIQSLGLHGFDIQDKKILHENNGAVKFRGIARNTTGVKSMDAFDLFWFEEAQTASEQSIELLEPTLREDGAELWYTMNRGNSADPISKEHIKPHERDLGKYGFYEDDHILIIRINYYENPWFPDRLESQRKRNKLLWGRAKYSNVWEGDFNDTVDNAIIHQEWFEAAIDAHKIDKLKKIFKPHGFVIASHDPSDTGEDDKGFSLRHGSIIKIVKAKETGEIDEGCDWATDLAIQNNAGWFVYDGDGMGAGLKRQVATNLSGTSMKYHMFRGSLSGSGQDHAEDIYMPQYGDDETNPKTYAETFKNNRAQYYIMLANRFYNTYRCVVKGEYVDPDEMISLDSDGIDNIMGLRKELCGIPKKDNGTGLIQIMNKKEMKLLKIDSPNMADSIMMSLFMPPIQSAPFEPLNYQPMSIV